MSLKKERKKKERKGKKITLSFMTVHS